MTNNLIATFKLLQLLILLYSIRRNGCSSTSIYGQNSEPLHKCMYAAQCQGYLEGSF